MNFPEHRTSSLARRAAGRKSARGIKLTVCSLFLLGAVVFYLASVSGGSAAGRQGLRAGPGLRIRLPQGIPESVWRSRIPADNPLTAEKVALGEALFFDKRLSSDGTLSCATCHDPASAFADSVTTAVGVRGQVGARNVPTILNAVFDESLFWDGRAGSLEEQVKEPLVNPLEMGMGSYDEVVARVAAIPEYRQQFRKVFQAQAITVDALAKAIAAFERTRLSGNSPFDRYAAGDGRALTETQKRGWELFRGKARCITCHTFNPESPFFTDFKFHNTGAAKGISRGLSPFTAIRVSQAGGEKGDAPGRPTHFARGSDLGRYLITGRADDIGAFKTPTLRDVELTAPYLHDGSARTLLDVMRFYNRGGERSPYLDERIRPLGLTEQEMNDLVEFMRALTSDDVLLRARSTGPQTRTPVPVPPAR